MKALDASCRHQWIIARWNTQEKYRVAELLMCQSCSKIKSWTDVVDQNHVHDSVGELCDLVIKYRGRDQVDPDALREAFLTAVGSGNLTIPEAKEHIKAKYNLYAPIDPKEEDKD